MSEIQLRVKQLFTNQELVNKMQATMTPQKQEMFKTAILSIVASNKSWEKVDPVSIMSSALISATLDLPINPNLGFAYIIPYGDQAQFQIGYKGIIQLAIRSGQYKTISVAPVYEGQLINNDPLKGLEIDFNKPKGELLGYVAYFALINGFEKYLYMTVAELQVHAGKFSQTYKSDKKWIKDKSLWVTDFDSMASKTVLKLLLSKFGIMSVELQKAVVSDQASVGEDEQLNYIDTTSETIEAESELLKFIRDEVTTLEALENVATQIKPNTDEATAYEAKFTELSKTADQNAGNDDAKNV